MPFNELPNSVTPSNQTSGFPDLSPLPYLCPSAISVDEIPKLTIHRRLHPQISQIGTDGFQASDPGRVPFAGVMPGNATFLLETDIGSVE
jgi:hypothetical protein